jgi:hypothetical protein
MNDERPNDKLRSEVNRASNREIQGEIELQKQIILAILVFQSINTCQANLKFRLRWKGRP